MSHTLAKHVPVCYAEDKKEYTVDLPGNHCAILYGTVTAGWIQKVTASVVGADTGTVVEKHTFEGAGNGILKVIGTFSPASTVTVTPVDKPRKIVLTFQAEHPNEGFKDSKVTHKEANLSNYATFYTFFSEDGYDNDDHDTDFCISILPTTK